MRGICRSVVALAATASALLAFNGQPFGVNPGGFNYFRDFGHQNIKALWENLAPGPEEAFIWHGKPGEWQIGTRLTWADLYLPRYVAGYDWYGYPYWPVGWEYDWNFPRDNYGYPPYWPYCDSLVANAKRLKEAEREPVCVLFTWDMPKFLPDWSKGRPEPRYVSPCPFGWDEVFPEESYPGNTPVSLFVYTDIIEGEYYDGYMATFPDDLIDTVFHWALAENVLGELMDAGWLINPYEQPVEYQQWKRDMRDMAARLKAAGAEDTIDYFIVGYVGAPVDAYYRVFVWEPPLDMGDQRSWPDSIVLCGKGSYKNEAGKDGYPSPIENPDTTWAVDNLHYALKKPLDSNRLVEFCTRIVLLPDTSIDTIDTPSDTVAVVRVHIWVREAKRPMLMPNIGTPPSLTRDFVLVVSSEFRDWVVSTTNPQWKWDNYIQPLFEILEDYLPDVKRVVWLGEQNAGDHGGTPEPGGKDNPVDRWGFYYNWITSHGLPGYPGKCYAWRDSMRSHKMNYPPWYITDPTGFLDYASEMLIKTGGKDLIDGISFNLYICHWAENWDPNDREADPYRRIPSDMEQIAAFNDSLGGKEILVREIYLPIPVKKWDDKDDFSQVFKGNSRFGGLADISHSLIR